MKSRVHLTYKTTYRVANWAAYDRALVRRGDVTVWLSPAAIAGWRREYNEERPKKGRGGLTPAAYAQQLTARTKTATVTAGL